jgi:uncharacterized protein (TIGR03083 family)
MEAVMDTWQAIRDERASFVNALAELPDADWDKPSLCGAWTVRDVVAHMTSTANMTPPKFFGKMIGSGFSFQKMTAKEIENYSAGKSTADLVDGYRTRVDARTAPPGPAPSWLGETIVHGEDIFRALGSYRPHPSEHVLAVADFYQGSNLLIGAKDRISGVTLRATDAEWTHGTGPEVAGPAIALVMAMTGRAAALADLTGEGVMTLRKRIPH